MHNKNSFDESNLKNYPIQEENPVEFENNYDDLDSYAYFNQQETNQSFNDSEIRKNKTNRKPSYLFRLLASFLVVCAFVAIVQTTFKIPVFSDLFNPSSSASSPIYTPPVYNIDALNSTYKDVNFTVTVYNVTDFSANEYGLLLVKSGTDTNEYLSTIPSSVKNANKKIISAKTTTDSIAKCVSTSGAKSLSASTEYVLLVLENEKIVLKQTITTKDFIHIYNVTLNRNGEYVQFTENINPSFTNYSYIYIEIFDYATNFYVTFAGSSPGDSQYISSKELSAFSKINIKIYCKPTNLMGLEDFETKTIGSDAYYLLYTQDGIDITPYL